MTDNPNRLAELMERFSMNEVDEAEFRELCELISVSENEEIIKTQLLSDLHETKFTRLPKSKLDRILRNILRSETAPVFKMSWKKIAAAVAIIILGAGAWFIFNQTSKKEIGRATTTIKQDVAAPRTNRATITLANGKQVFLDSSANGQIATQTNVKVIKLAEGRITYTVSDIKANNSETVYNTLTNPRGSKVIDMTLADGSRIWLNAGSSVTYPVTMAGRERKVAITGEAYFEVTHDPSRPFIVGKGNMQVQVLGTMFNVNAYEDEADIKVTLLQGSVKVSRDNTVNYLRPGQQAILRQAQDNKEIKIMANVNLDGVMAWKNGLFSFEKSDIKTIMRQVSRWYDIDIAYEGDTQSTTFNGEVARNANVSKVFEMLEYAGIHFSIENESGGRKRIVVRH